MNPLSFKSLCIRNRKKEEKKLQEIMF